MSTLTICIVIAFVFGYLCIAMESLTKVNKAAVALLMFVACWTLYMFDPTQFLQLMHPDFMASATEAMGANAVLDKVTTIVQEHLGDTSTTLFFLMGAMTIVEIVDQNGGFNWVRGVMKNKVEAGVVMAHRLYDLHPVGHSRQPHYQHRDDYDITQARQQPC